jgi:NADPH2:quinone reductase
VREQWDALVPHIASGVIDPPVGATFGLDDASDALLTLDERRATGKILLTP